MSEMDSQIESYLNSVKNNHGIKKIGSGDMKAALRDDGRNFEEVCEYSRDWSGMNGGQTIDVFRYEADSIPYAFVAQWRMRSGIDGVEVLNFQFDHEPSKKDIKTADLVRQLELSFGTFGDLSAEYTCWECGQETHVLDADYNNISSDKLVAIQELAEEKYCGC